MLGNFNDLWIADHMAVIARREARERKIKEQHRSGSTALGGSKK